MVPSVDEIEREIRNELNGLSSEAARRPRIAARMRLLAKNLNQRASGFEKPLPEKAPQN